MSVSDEIKRFEAPYCHYASVIDPTGEVDHIHYGLWTEGTWGLAAGRGREVPRPPPGGPEAPMTREELLGRFRGNARTHSRKPSA